MFNARFFTRLPLSFILIFSFSFFALSLGFAEDKMADQEENYKLIEYIVARVNNKVITFSEFQEVVNDLKKENPSSKNEDELKVQALDLLITDRLVRSISEIRKMKPSEEDINQAVENFKKHYNIDTDEQLTEALRRQGKSILWLRDMLERQMLQQRVIMKNAYSNVNVSEDEITDYYNRNIKSYSTGDEVRIRQLFVSTTDKDEDSAFEHISQAYQKLKKGMKFEDAVTAFADQAARKNDGDLGYFKKGEIIKALDEAAFKLSVGEFSTVLKSDNGYHIIQVTEKKMAKVLSLQEVKEDIMAKLRNAKLEKESLKYLKKLRKDNYVVILDPELKKLMEGREK